MAIVVALTVGAGVPAWANGVTERVSLSSSGKQGNLESEQALDADAMTDDGRYVVFQSLASNLVPNDTNGAYDVFLRDRRTRQTLRVSVSSTGGQGSQGSSRGTISADARYVAFDSDADDLVPNDTNGQGDIFVRDLTTGTTQRVNVGTDGSQANGSSYGSAISANGRYVVFASNATNLVSGDTNGSQDIFVRDRKTGTTSRVSVGTRGRQANGGSFAGIVSADGRFVVFSSDATNLVAHDTNLSPDVFVRDRQLGTTARVNVGAGGVEAAPGSFSFGTDLAAGGRYVAFQSDAGNLVAGDANGATDVFVRDRKRKLTDRVVLAPTGAPLDPGSFGGSLSASGRFVAVSSRGSARGSADAYVIDRHSGKTRLLNAPLAGYPQQVAASTAVAISADGRRACFDSSASNLVPGDTNETLDVFVRNLSAW
ncbi:MAG: hypothetical protein WAS21_15555 [Geminicoccaceae bacterium]